MESILDELFYGNIDPLQQGEPQSPEFARLKRRHAAWYPELSEVLKQRDPALYERLEKLESLRGEIEGERVREMFRLGFALGLQLGVESLTVQNRP